MKSKIQPKADSLPAKKQKLFLFIFVALLAAAPVYADFVFCGGTGEAECKASDLARLVYTVVNFLISMAGLVSVFFIVWGGIQMLTSGGNMDSVKQAKSTIFNAILGLIIVFLAYIVIGYLANLILPGSGGSWETFIKYITG